MEKTEYDKKIEAYKLLSEQEQSLTKMRHSLFTRLLSISFLLPGLAVNLSQSGSISIWKISLDYFGIVFMLGFVFYCFAVFHYWWYHRYSHKHRSELKRIEKELDMNIYRLRRRPVLSVKFKGKRYLLKAHFDWAIYIIGILYAFVTAFIIGWCIFVAVLLFILVSYFLLLIYSSSMKEEPLEDI